MKEVNKDQLIELSKRELAALDDQIATLVAQRAGIAQFLKAAGHVVAPAQVLPEDVIGGRKSGSGADDEPSSPRIYSSRKANAKIIDEALDIILRHGQPLTAPEILPEHSHAKLMTAEALYRLIYNRVISGSVYSLSGAFWPVDKPIPDGWDVSQAKRVRRIKSYARNENDR
jgi:hypothetical protein